MYTENWKASNGKFKIIGIDTFAHEDWIVGEYEGKDDAIEYVKKETKGKDMLLMRIYDDKEKLIYQSGRY